MRIVGEITTAGGRLLCVFARLIAFLSSVGERVEFGGHHPELVRKRGVMGIGHLAKALSTLADRPVKRSRARRLQLMRHATTYRLLLSPLVVLGIIGAVWLHFRR